MMDFVGQMRMDFSKKMYSRMFILSLLLNSIQIWRSLMILSSPLNSKRIHIISEISSWSKNHYHLMTIINVTRVFSLLLNSNIFVFLIQKISFVRIFISALLLEHSLASGREKDVDIFIRWCSIAPKYTVDLTYNVIDIFIHISVCLRCFFFFLKRWTRWEESESILMLSVFKGSKEILMLVEWYALVSEIFCYFFKINHNKLHWTFFFYLTKKTFKIKIQYRQDK